MNFLGHAVLSFGVEAVVAGNMMGDFVRNKELSVLPPEVQQGVLLHRAIDEFTDNHTAIKYIQSFLKPAYGLYALPISDILLDYLVATDKRLFKTHDDLAIFAEETYTQINLYQHLFSPVFAGIFTHMRRENWLTGYRSKEGIIKSLSGLQRRATYLQNAPSAFYTLLEHQQKLTEAYQYFFSDIYNFSKKFLTDKNLYPSNEIKFNSYTQA